jgi:hypothetical protein
MNLLQQLAHMLTQHQAAQQSHPAPAAAYPQAPNQLSVQPLGSNRGMPLNQHPEDASYIHGPQGFVPMNADVGQFNVRGRGMQEDEYVVPSQQGFTPLNADIAHFQMKGGLQSGRSSLQPANVRWQNTNGQRRNMINPQVRDNGYFYDN